MIAAGFLPNQGTKAHGMGYEIEKAPTLRGGGGTVPGVLLVLDDQGGGCIRWNYNELSPALRARMNGHPPVVVMENESSNDDRIRAVPIDGTGRTD